MQLTSFSISGFRALADVGPVPLERPSILTGRNDSGKSSVLDALAFLLDPYRKALPTDFPIQAEDAREPDEERVLVVTGVFELNEDDQKATGLADVVSIRRSAGLESNVVTDYGYEAEQQVPQDERLRNLEEARRSLEDLKEAARAYGVWAEPPARSKQSFIDVLRPIAETAPKCLGWEAAGSVVLERFPWFLYRTGVDAADVNNTVLGALKLLYREILDRDDFKDRTAQLQTEITQALTDASESLCKAIERNCDGYSSVSVIPQISFREDSISKPQVIAYKDGKKVSVVEQSGTGRRQQIVQAIWEWENREVMRPNAADSVVIAYDEPDVSLDYERQRNFMSVIRQQSATGNARAIVATHSVQMIDQVPLDNVVHLEHTNGTTLLNRVADSGSHDDYSTFIGRLTEELGVSTSSVLFERCFLLVEGESERKAFPKLFYLATKRRLQEAGIVIFSGDGNTAVLKLVKCLSGMGKPVYVIVDADSKRDHPRTFNRDKLLEHGVPDGHIDYLGDANELEELFSDEQWSGLGNEFWPHPDGEPWESGHFSALRSSGKFSAKVSDLLNVKSKPQLMARMAELITSREAVPPKLVAAFDRLMSTLENGQHS
jgi:energy-coupling factor transporter ATP-binding protein EcfA2